MLETINTIGGASGIISLICLVYVVFTKLGRMEVKICTLWHVYVEGVLERATKEGFASRSSAITINRRGEDILGESIKQKIKSIVETRRHKKVFFVKSVRCDGVFKCLIINEILDDIKERASEENIDAEPLVAAVMLYTEKICNSTKKH